MASSKEEAVEHLHKRSLRSLPPTYAPSLVFSHGKKYRDHTFYTLCDGYYHVKSIPEMRRMNCVASNYGWLILRSYCSTECYLFNPTTLTKIQLPPLRHKSYDLGLLASHPDDPNCVVMLFSGKKTSCMFCRIGNNSWIVQKLRFKTKNPELLHYYVSVLSCKGKIYLFLLHGTATIDVHGTTLSMQLHERESPKHSFPEITFCLTFFVESCDEIFQVHTIHLGCSFKIVRRLDVFKLESATMSWVKVEHIGDRIFLLGTGSTSFSSTELGVKGNCIYFCIRGYTGFYRFDMDDNSVTSCLPCRKKLPNPSEPFWVVPDCKLQVKNEVANVENPKYDLNYEKGGWLDLPLELLELIMSGLFQGDCIRFRLCCKTWMSITPPIRLCNPVEYKSESQQLPWLLSFSEDDTGQCNFYHPIYSDRYSMNKAELAGAIVRHAKYGWLLMSRGEHSVFFFNPFTTETIKLPDLDRKYPFMNISFSSPPTCSDCMVFGHYISGSIAVTISGYRKGEDDWCLDRFELTNRFLSSYCNPVFCDGVFYTLGKDGQLGVCDPDAEEDEDVWRILPNTSLEEFSSMSSQSLQTTSARSFLVEYDGEMISVFVGFMGRPVWVFKLDRSKMEWIRLESLGDKVIFLSETTSILVPAGVKGIEDRIYFPRFDGKEIMFYSLRSKSYHSLGGKSSHPDWSNTSEYWNCTWITHDLQLKGQPDAHEEQEDLVEATQGS